MTNTAADEPTKPRVTVAGPVALVLYLFAMLIWSIPGGGSEDPEAPACSIPLLQAFHVYEGDGDSEDECIASARRHLGLGAVPLALSLPFAVAYVARRQDAA